MWIFCMFDLPTGTKAQQKRASKFRKALIDDGFEMMQFSVYNRFCASLEAAECHIKHVKEAIPREGKVSIVKLTDKQFGDIETYFGKKPQPVKNVPQQLTLF